MTKTIEIEDFMLAAALVSVTGVEPILVRRSRLPIQYVFEESDLTRGIIEAFSRNQLRVDPVLFSIAERQLHKRATGVNEPWPDPPQGGLYGPDNGSYDSP